MSFPLKEGLRHYTMYSKDFTIMCRNVFSIKRRIATKKFVYVEQDFKAVEMSFPLKEGLRQILVFILKFRCCL